ncbi:undecaprenyldiphospho-muramoylpentapeptide beta-N-acetylglucosaminyltransferase [Acidobacteriota bacterium]
MRPEAQNRRILISGGGTAGHIHPALAVGQKLKEKDKGIEITFVGTTRKLEKTLMDHYKTNFIPLKIEGIKGKGLGMLRSLLILPSAFIRSLSLLRKIKPALSIGVGGYSSGPILLLSAWMGIPTLLMEQNSIPGLTNRMLIPWIKRAVVSFEGTLPYFKKKGIFIGNPVREEFYNITQAKRTGKLNLLIFGGSQGSRFLNNAVIDTLPLFKDNKDSLVFYHQTGEQDLDRVKQAYTDLGFPHVLVKPFLFNIADYFQKSDLVICRSGATTVAELIAARKASLLFPFAGAADNHQLLNARELEKVKGAEIITEDKFTAELFASKIHRFMNNTARLDQMEKNLGTLRKTDVADRISDLCFELMLKKQRSN